MKIPLPISSLVALSLWVASGVRAQQASNAPVVVEYDASPHGHGPNDGQNRLSPAEADRKLELLDRMIAELRERHISSPSAGAAVHDCAALVFKLEQQIAELKQLVSATNASGRSMSNHAGQIFRIEKYIDELAALLGKGKAVVPRPEPGARTPPGTELEDQIGELEKQLLALKSVGGEPNRGKPTEAEWRLLNLEKMVADLQMSLSPSPYNPRSGETDVFRLENRITELETLLRQREVRSGPGDRSFGGETDVSRLENRITELETLLRQREVRSGPGDRSFGGETDVSRLENRITELETLLRQREIRSGLDDRSFGGETDVSRLENRITELETLLRQREIRSGLDDRSFGGETDVSRLEIRITELETLLRQREIRSVRDDRIFRGETHFSRLENRITNFERMLRESRPGSVPTPPAPVDQESHAEIMRKIYELESRLSTTTARPPPDSGSVPTPPAPVDQESLAEIMRKIDELESRLSTTTARPPPDSGSVPKPPAPVYPDPGRPRPAPAAFCATLRLKSKPSLYGPLASGGPNLLGIFEYELIRGTRGGPAPSSPVIRVAHGIRWGGKDTAVMNRPVGTVIALDLVPLRCYPELNRAQRVGGGPGGDEPVIYTPRLD